MLFISLDEGGRFERPEENEQGNFIAGVIYECQSYDDIEKEKERIEKWLKKCCNETIVDGNPCSYPEDIHNKWTREGILNVRNVAAVKNMLIRSMPDFVQGNGDWEKDKPVGKYYIYGLVGVKEGIKKYEMPEISNLINDSVAGNRYEHMVYRTIEDVLFYNPYVYDDKIVLDIATRQLVTKTPEERREAIKLGYDQKSPNHFSLTVQNSYKVALTSAIQKSNHKDIQFDICVRPINYNAENTKEYAFLYLADTLCSALDKCRGKSTIGFMLKNMLSNANRITGNEYSYVFAYNDIDEIYRKAYKYAISGNYYDAISCTYFEDFEDNNLLTIYRGVWFSKIEELILGNCTPNNILHSLEQLDEYMHDANSSVSRGWYVYNGLRKVLASYVDDRRYSKILFRMYVIEMGLYNHIGDCKKALNSYKNAMQYSQYVDIEDHLGLRDMRAVSLCDLGKYKEAVDFTKKTIEYKEKVRDMKMAVNPDNHEVFVHYARGLSQLGQCYSFNGQYEEARRCFVDALSMFGNNTADKQRTLSYYLHMLIEKGDKEEYIKASGEYFGTTNIGKQLEHIEKLDETSERFALYLYVKGLYVLLKDEITEELINKLVAVCDRSKVCEYDHPWSLIYKYLAFIIYSYDKNRLKIANKYIGYSKEVVQNTTELLVAIAELGEKQFEMIKENKDISNVGKYTYMHR